MKLTFCYIFDIILHKFGVNNMSLFEDFLKIEKENDFYDRKVLGIKYWEFIRFGVFHEILVRKTTASNLLLATKPKGIRAYLLSLKNIKKYLGFTKISKADLLIISHPRRVKQNNKFYNIFTDPVVEGLSDEYKCITLEEPCWCSLTASKTSHLFPVETKNIYFTDLYELSFLLKKKLFVLFHHNKYKQVLKEINDMLEFFNDRYNIDLNQTRSHFVDKIIYNLTMKEKWTKVIKKINPKAVILYYFPTTFKGIIINICNEMNIPTIELQHGVITRSDPPEHKTYDINNCFNVPKYLFAFGNKLVDRKFLTTREKNLKIVGFPFLEKKVNTKYNLPSQLKKNEKYILIVSQDVVGKEMSEFASELATLLQNQKEYKIIYKYHPNEVNLDYECLKKDNIITIKKFGEEIYKYQYFSLVQIGVYSTSLYEGLAFGLPTIILKKLRNANQTIETLSFMKQGIYTVETPLQAFKVINGTLEKPKTTDVEQLWKMNSINNIKQQIKKIVKH